MCNVEKLYYHVKENAVEGSFIEGNPSPEILFVLHEPHAKEEDVNDFWFREKVLKKNKTGNPYYIAFVKIAKLLLNEGDDSVALHKCALINVFPFCGARYASDDCCSVIGALKSVNASPIESISKDKPEDTAANRKYIIEHTTAKYIVTTCKVFESLVGNCETEAGLKFSFTYKNKLLSPTLCATEYKGKILVAIYHPSYKRAYLRDVSKSSFLDR